MLMLMFTLICMSHTFYFCVHAHVILYVQGLMVKCTQDYHIRAETVAFVAVL